MCRRGTVRQTASRLLVNWWCDSNVSAALDEANLCLVYDWSQLSLGI